MSKRSIVMVVAAVAFTTFAVSVSVFGADNAPPEEVDLRCSIKSDKTVYSLGETPRIDVRIKNEGDKPVLLVGSLDASDVKWRYPYCYYTITGQNGDPINTGVGRCGMMNALRRNDFVRVEPGATFNPYMDIGPTGFFSSGQINAYAFQNPGIYRITFHYDTSSNDMRQWEAWDDVEAAPGKPSIRTLWKQVPKTTLVSNTLTIEVTSE
jgi:hypothetical protein